MIAVMSVPVDELLERQRVAAVVVAVVGAGVVVPTKPWNPHAIRDSALVCRV
jgi:hypothetical protein